MKVFVIVMAVQMLSSCCVHGDNWWQVYDEALKHYTEEDLNKEHPEYTRARSFQHPLFQCPDMSPSPTVPTSVEFVKAADIKVIAALGDSLTTAIAANGSTILSVPIEYRQVSWSIGGYGTYQDVITLANIVKLFNPNVLGPAPVWTLSGYPTTINDTGFNLAVTGHNSLNFSEQTRHMIDTFKTYPGLNFTEDWKLVTVLIGMNDICDYCKNSTLFSADNFIHYMTESLDMMMKEVPRLIVNIVQLLTMAPLREVQRPSIGCELKKKYCSCVVLPEDNSTDLVEMKELNVEFQRRLEKLLLSDRFFKHDFAVVLQPYVAHAKPPRLPNGTIDLSYFTADCFHFTIKGHEELAKGLWNNMFQPEGEKTMLETISSVKLICPPKEHPYIYTRPKAVATSLPQTASSATSLPQTASSAPSLPQTASSAPSLPQTTSSAPSLPQTASSSPSLPQTASSATSLPQTASSATSLPQTASSAPSLPQTASSAPSLPQTTSSAPSLPQALPLLTLASLLTLLVNY